MSLIHNKKAGVFLVCFLLSLSLGLLLVAPHLEGKSTPALIFKSWVHYTDNDYSQGVAYIEVYDNSTGSFKLQENITNSESGCGVNASCSVQLIVGYVANRTHLGWDVSDNSLGRNFIQFNVSVAHSNGTTIFAQQNGTYLSNRYIGNGLFVFEHSVILNFETEYAIRYTVTMHYESYYGGGFIKKYVYYNDMSNVTWVTWDDCDIASDGDLFTYNGTAGTLITVTDDCASINLEPHYYVEVAISHLSSGTSFNFMIRNSSAINNDIWTISNTGTYTMMIEDFPLYYALDEIDRLYFRGSGGSGANKTVQLDYLNFYYWNKAQYGYYNDGTNTTWIDDSAYCSTSSAGGWVFMEDNEAGHGFAYMNDTGLNVDLTYYSTLSYYWSQGGESPYFDNWSLVLHWSNGSSYAIWEQTNNNESAILYTYNVFSLCDTENTTITAISIIGYGSDTVGEDHAFDYLYLHETPTWHDQQMVFYLLGENFEGMLLAGVSLIGLVMIPSGTVIGALMVKNKTINEGNWLIPLFIVLIGFALFIGGMA